jgi:hypothetical protein
VCYPYESLTCHRNSDAPKTATSGAKKQPVAAVYPIMGGIAPTTAPTHVFHTLRCFIGV